MRNRHPVLLAVLATAALALVLRAWRLDAGLPTFVDEALPFRHALGMWNADSGTADSNPHFFRYPSLSIYAFLLVQAVQMAWMKAAGTIANTADYLLAFRVDPSAMVVGARGLCIALDVVTVVVVVVLGERMRRGAGWIAGLVVAAAPGMILLTRAIYTETFLATFTIAALERMLAWRRHGGAVRLSVAVACIGLATGAKYPGAALLVPLAVVLIQRLGVRGLAWWPAAAAGAAFVFALTTPWALLDRATFARDLNAIGRMTSEGHFGNLERIAAAFQVRSLAAELGWPALGMLVLSVALAVGHLAGRRGAAATRMEAGPADPAAADRLVLLTALAVLLGPVVFARVEVARYLVPVLPIVALLATDAALAIAALLPARLRPMAGPAAAALIVLPVVPGGWAAARARGEVTRGDAARWIEAHVPADRIVLQEHYAAPLLDRMTDFHVRTLPEYLHASAPWRERWDAKPERAAVTLPLATVGHVTVPIADAAGRVHELRVVERAPDLNRATYDGRLLAGVDVVVTSGNVRERFAADPTRWAGPLRFYALLDSTARQLARFAPAGDAHGPVVTVYALTPRTHRALDALGPLDSLWWTSVVRPEYRSEFARLTGTPVASGAQRTGPDGEPLPWVASLAPVFVESWSEFAQLLALELGRRDRSAPARDLARAVVLMQPDETGPALTYSVAARHLGAPADARRVVERTLAALLQQGLEPPGALRLEHADLLATLGESARARSLYDAMALAPDTLLASVARERLRALRGSVYSARSHVPQGPDRQPR